MNFLNFVELVQQHHPHTRDNEIRILLNSSSDDFCRRTEIYRPIYSQMTVAGQRYYDISPSTDDTDVNVNAIIKVLDVWINDVKIPRLLTPPSIDDDEYEFSGTGEESNIGTPSTSSDERFWYIGGPNGDNIGIVEKSTNALTRDGKTSNFQSMSEAKELRIFSIALARHLLKTDSYRKVDNPSSSEDNMLPKLFRDIPVQFHDALLFKVIARLYEGAKNLNIDLANRFDTKYLELVNEAKKWGKSGKTQGGYIKPVYF